MQDKKSGKAAKPSGKAAKQTDDPPDPSSDDEFWKLARDVQSGEVAFSDLLQLLQQRLSAYVKKRRMQSHDADDIVQEVSLSIIRAFCNYDPSRPFLPWAMTICSRRANDYLRGLYRTKEVYTSNNVEVEVGQPSPEDRLSYTELLIEVRKCLDGLPPNDRAALWLRYFDGLPVKDVAEAIGDIGANCSMTKGILHRARVQIAEYLDQEGLTDLYSLRPPTDK